VQQATVGLHSVTGCRNLKQAVRITRICVFVFHDAYVVVNENFPICIPVHLWYTGTFMVYRYIYGIPVRFMVYRYIYGIPVDLWYTGTFMVYRYIYGIPLHLWYTGTFMVYRYIYGIPVHLWYTVLHVFMYFSLEKLYVNHIHMAGYHSSFCHTAD